MKDRKFTNRPVDKISLSKSKKYMWKHIQSKVKHKPEPSGFSIGDAFRSLIAAPVKLASVSVVAVLVIVALVFGNVFPGIVDVPTVHASFEMTADSEDSAGVDSDSSFTLTSSEDYSERIIAGNLVVTPEIELDIEKIGEGRYRVKPAELEPNTVYNFTIDGEVQDYSWAYQIKDTFKITGTLPGNQENYVPVDTGIEFYFSHENYDYENFENYFEISPAVNGSFQNHYRTVSFVPKGGLKEATIYTVTLKKGLELNDSDLKLEEDYVFKFETDSNIDVYDGFRFKSEYYEVSTEMAVALDVYSYGYEDVEDFEIKVYKYPDANAYLQALKENFAIPEWCFYTQRLYSYPTDGLQFVGTFEGIVDKINYTSFIYFPGSDFDTGYYLFETELGRGDQALVQVTDLSAYTNISISDSLVWVNDIETGQPVEGAKVELGNIGESYTTDEDGIVTFETPDEWKLSWQDRNSDFVRITAPDGKILINQITPYSNEDLGRHYWQSFTTDRPMYQPSDTIKFWGFLKPKASAAPLEDLTVRLEYSWDTFVKEAPITLEDDGTFVGELEINGFAPGYYNLYVFSGDKKISYANMQITDYIKPAYDFSVEADKNAVFFDEEMIFTVKSNYFDGTPLPYLEFEYSEDYSYKNLVSETDKNGEAVIKANPKKGSCSDDYCYDIHSYYFSADIANAEEAEIRASTSVRVFDSHLNIVGTSNVEDGQANIDIKTDWIDLSRLNDESNTSYNDYLGKVAKDRSVSGRITEIYWEKIPDGEYYDFINKKVVKKYRYEKRENSFGEFDIETDRNGEVNYQFETREGKYYRINLVASDDQGNDAHDILYVYGKGRSSSYDYYEVEILNGEEDESNWWSRNMFDIGDTVKAVINNGDAIMDDVDARFMFMQFSNGLQEYKFSDSQYYDFEFGKNDVPNVFVSAVWFDGQHYETAYQASAAYKRELERLSVEIETDEKYYSPGEEVTLSVNVSDAKGKPAKAKVNLNLVDEAFYKISYDNFTDPLDDIYSNNSNGIMITYDSHDNPISTDDVGGKGGCFTGETKILMADGSYKEIQDIEIGDIVLTKDHEFSGKLVEAKVTNTVSHFVSEYLVFNEGLEVTDVHIVWVNGGWDMAGNVKIGDSMLSKDGEEIEISSIRKVIEPVWVYNFEVDGKHTYFANNFYVHNEKGGGSGVRDQFEDTALFDVVETDGSGKGEITFTLPDNITSWRVTARAIDGDNLKAGFANAEVVVSLPFFADLIMNREYSVKDEPTIKFRAYGDALDEEDEVEFIVSAESLGEIASDKIDGEAFEGSYYELPDLELGNHDVTLFAESGKYDDALQKEIEVKGSRLKTDVNELMRDVSAKTRFDLAEDGPTEIMFTDGGVGYYYGNLWSLYYSYGDRLDQRLSQVIGAELLEEYFGDTRLIDDSDVVANYQEEGLTLLPYSDPDLRLSALTLYVETNPSRYDDYALKEYFYGFYKNANSNLEEVVLSMLGLASMNEPVLLSLREIRDAPELSIEERLYIALAFDALGSQGEAEVIYKDVLGQLAEDNAYETALGAMLAASLQDNEASALLWEFVEIKGFEDDLDKLAKIGYVRNSLEHVNPNPVKFKVKIGDHTESVKLEKWESFSLMAFPGDEVSVSVLDGDLAANMYYSEVVEPKDFEKDERLYIHRAYLVDGVETNEFKEGDLVKVHLDVSFDGSLKRPYFKVTDVLPSGLRLVSDVRGPDYYYSYTYPYRKNGQEIYFSWYKDEYSSSKTITYYARVVNPGEFYADPAKVQSYYDPSIANISKSNSVTISR